MLQLADANWIIICNKGLSNKRPLLARSRSNLLLFWTRLLIEVLNDGTPFATKASC